LMVDRKVAQMVGWRAAMWVGSKVGQTVGQMVGWRAAM